MDNIKNVLTPVSSMIDLDKLGLVKAARDQLKGLNLGELILITDDFNLHNRLNQIGEVRLKKIKRVIQSTEEYKYLKGE